MDYISLIAIAITIIGAVVKLSLESLNKYGPMRQQIREEGPQSHQARGYARQRKRAIRNARIVLIVFAIAVCSFGIFTLVRYWNVLKQNEDALYFSIWLFFAMVAGMFVQVLAHNYRSGNPLFHVEASQLIFPLLFSIIVFYPIWAIGVSATHSFFSIHAAFLNGYFWESIVSSAQPLEKYKRYNF